MSIFKDKVLMITGGTGSFGNAVLKRFIRTDIGEILLLLIPREDANLTDIGTNKALQHGITERSGSAGDHEDFVFENGHILRKLESKKTYSPDFTLNSYAR